MGQTRKKHTTESKSKVALEAAKGVNSLSELAARYTVHPTQITPWKRQLLDSAPVAFERSQSGSVSDAQALTAPLYQEIGRLKMEVDYGQEKALSAPAKENPP